MRITRPCFHQRARFRASRVRHCDHAGGDERLGNIYRLRNSRPFSRFPGSGSAIVFAEPFREMAAQPLPKLFDICKSIEQNTSRRFQLLLKSQNFLELLSWILNQLGVLNGLEEDDYLSQGMLRILQMCHREAVLFFGAGRILRITWRASPPVPQHHDEVVAFVEVAVDERLWSSCTRQSVFPSDGKEHRLAVHGFSHVVPIQRLHKGTPLLVQTARRRAEYPIKYNIL